ASSSAGINLLSALELQFGATLINTDYSTEGDSPTVRKTQRSFEVSIPTVNYALNMASTSRNAFSIEASPSVVAIEGQTSRFFEGANVLIVPGGDETEPLERDIGIDLQVTPNEIADGYIDLTAALELSNLAGSMIGTGGGGAGPLGRDTGTALQVTPTEIADGYIDLTAVLELSTRAGSMIGTGAGSATIVQTEKTSAEASARIPFGRAIALGSGATMTLRDAAGGTTGLSGAPAIGRLFGNEQASAKRNDVLVLLTARRGIAHDDRNRVDEAALSHQLFGTAPAGVGAVSRLPSQAPGIDFMEWLR